MTINKIDNFDIKGEILFRPLLENYGYKLEEKKINEINGNKWSAHHIYLNERKGLKIIIKQEPYYTDYGFSFFIFKLGTDKYNILYNVPHENQDKEDKFLDKACNDLFSNTELSDIISGKSWKELRNIPTISPEKDTKPLTAFPNPVKDNLFVSVKNDKIANAEIQLVDVQGNIMRQQNLLLTKGTTSISFDTSELVKGIYTLEVKGDTTLELKIVKE